MIRNRMPKRNILDIIVDTLKTLNWAQNQHSDLRSLDKYPSAGHAAILKKHKYSWQKTEYVRRLYSKKVSTARRRYRELLKMGFLRENDQIWSVVG